MESYASEPRLCEHNLFMLRLAIDAQAICRGEIGETCKYRKSAFAIVVRLPCPCVK